MEDLYMKHRPTKFDQVVGQDAAVAMLKGMVKGKRVPQAILFKGPSGCLRADSPIYDPTDGTTKTVEQRWKDGIPFHVISLDESTGRLVIATALPPMKYPAETIYRVSAGASEFHVTGGHLLKTTKPGEFLPVDSFVGRPEAFADSPLVSTWGDVPSTRPSGAPRSSDTVEDSEDDYPTCLCSDDAPLQSEGDIDPACSPSTVDAPTRTRVERRGAPASESRHSRRRSPDDRLSMPGSSPSEGPCALPSTSQIVSASYAPIESRPPSHSRSLSASHLTRTAFSPFDPEQPTGIASTTPNPRRARRRLSASLGPPEVGQKVTGRAIVNSVVAVGQESYFDFHVPTYNNYWMSGCIHHNCGKTTLARIVALRLKCSPMCLHETNAADLRGIDDVRKIGMLSRLNPVGGPVRVFIIDEAQQMTKDAQSALLKILEDPQGDVHFFLCTTDPEKLLGTIRTRCTDIELSRVGDDDLARLVRSVLSAEDRVEAVDEEVIDKIVECSDGSPRKALVLLHSVIALDDKDQQLELIQKADERRQSIELCRLLISPRAQWADAVKILKDVEGEPESIRRHVLGYATSCLLSAKPNPRAFLVIEAFQDNFYDSKKAGLVAACFDVLRPKGR